jgi:hypothetical protein
MGLEGMVSTHRDREIDRINNALPRGADRLLVAELKARGLPWVVNNVETPRITNQLCLPPWQPRSSYLWPPRKVMFSDLVGSTSLAAHMDPEDLREVISAYQRCVADTVRRFDGFVAKYMGDGVLVYFGYSHAHEDDAERSVRAVVCQSSSSNC